MKLTHHASPTRSFLIILVIVFGTVYTALLLMQMQTRTAPAAMLKQSLHQNTTKVDSSDWKSYLDKNYPLNIFIPKDWIATYTDDLPGFYTVNFSESKNKSGIKIYISQSSFAGTEKLKGTLLENASGDVFTNYDDQIFTIKAGEYYYTFDGILVPNLKDELKEIIRLARFE